MQLVEVNEKEIGLILSREEAMIMLALYSVNESLWRDAKVLLNAITKRRLLRGVRRLVVEETSNYLNRINPVTTVPNYASYSKSPSTVHDIFEKIKLPDIK